MGFGIMFFGCFLLAETMSLELLGFILMFWGMKVASRHCDCFEDARKLCYAGFAFSAVKLAIQAADALGAELLGAQAEMIFGSVYTAFIMIFNIVLFRGVARIADDTGLPGIKSMAYADMFLSTLFLLASRVLYALVAVYPDAFGTHRGQLLGTAMLLPLIVTILTAVLIFRCYMRICLEGDEDMEERKSPFKSPMDFYDNDKYKKNTASAQGGKTSGAKSTKTKKKK